LNLWRHVYGRPTHGIIHILFRLLLLGESEVCQFEHRAITLLSKQDILELEIPVHNGVRVKVFKGTADLIHEVLCSDLTQTPLRLRFDIIS
jgi:hypothetical protein